MMAIKTTATVDAISINDKITNKGRLTGLPSWYDEMMIISSWPAATSPQR